MAQNAYSQKAQNHNDITAAAGLLGDAKRVEGVEGGHYVTEFDEEGATADDEITVRVTAKIKNPEAGDLETILLALADLGTVTLVDTLESSGFRAHVDNSGTFAQPGTRVPDSEWTKLVATFDVSARLDE